MDDLTAPMEALMTTIRTSCQDCGVIELDPVDLRLELASLSGAGNYRFACPSCGGDQHRKANHRVVSILLATGVHYEVVEDSAAITESEIRRFAAALDTDNWAEQLTADN